MHKLSVRKPGFTLIEILVVIALVAVLAAITIVAINPAKNFADARNTQRSADVAQILNAVNQYASEQGHTLGDLGTIVDCTPEDTTFRNDTVIGAQPGALDLAAALVDDYIVAIPQDPLVGNASNTGYRICKTDNSRVQVSAPQAENDKTIAVKR